MPITSKLSSVHITENVDIWHWLQVKATLFMDRIAFSEWPSGREITYREFFADIKRVAGALWNLGVRKGDVVLIFSANCIETPVVSYAIQAIGAVMTACNHSYKSNEVYDHVMECNTKVVVTSKQLLPVVKEVQSRCSTIKTIITYGEAEGTISYDQLLRYDGAPAPYVPINAGEDIANLYFSSGTTGKPKGVMHTHTTMTAIAEVFSHPDITFFPVEGQEATVMFLPVFHMFFGFVNCITLAHGKTTILMTHFDFNAYMKLNQDHKCRILFLVPPVATLLVKHADANKYDLSHVREIVCGAAPLGAEVENEIIEKFKLKALKQAYGMTECLVLSCHLTERKLGSAGILVANTECKVVDLETAEELGPGQEGELLFRGPQRMMGYFNKPEATAETIDKDGWLKTGDIGYYDEDGHFFVSGRTKELIKYKGFQVAPASLEDVLLSHSAVQDVAVMGLPDQMAGELPMAFIVLKPNQSVTEEEIKQFVADRVAPFKQLRGGVRFINEIPKSASGKILRRMLSMKLNSAKH